MNHSARYIELAKLAIKKAEAHFGAEFVAIEKNVLALRKGYDRYLTVKINFRDLSFYAGDYDMTFQGLCCNFPLRVGEAMFNENYDLPEQVA